ncbi:MAG: hypothetical protein EA356_08890 [Geminicoccaceae bacterium]|nr:MAG: hypothetical protein EA356_08890 [Geminicoccaceae bacterium]
MTTSDPLARTPTLELTALAWMEGGAVMHERLWPGELVIIDAEVQEQEAALVDTLFGLCPPLSGSVRFGGHDWQETPAELAAALRGRIGLVPRSGGWLEDLSTMANVLVQARYHRRTDAMALLAEAEDLANRFALPGVPLDPIDRMHPRDRLRAACVRGFLGAPRLVVVETPAIVWGSLLTPLVRAMHAVRDQGAAVLWFLTDDALFELPSLPANRRWQLRGQGVVRAGTSA